MPLIDGRSSRSRYWRRIQVCYLSCTGTSSLPDNGLFAAASDRRDFARRLTSWFARAARDLPWRRTRNLYAIWVSEVMLQQTQVATVIPYYERFLARFPSVGEVAAADEQEVLRLWEGLGYYRRARQMHAAAQAVVHQHNGEFPSVYESVRALPGIGRYTAGAILSIGMDARLPILEANTIRVLSRLAAFEDDPSSTSGQKLLWSLAEAILPARNTGQFNQALMELGSEICTSAAPQCEKCPVHQHCRALALGLQHGLPKPPKKVLYELVTEIAVVVRRGGKMLVRQYMPGERWAGLWDFPRFASVRRKPRPEDVAAGVAGLIGAEIAAAEKFATIKHGVTRFRITLHCYAANYAGRASPHASTSRQRWCTLDELAQLPLTMTARKISRLIAETRTRTTRRTRRAAAARP